MRLEEQKSIIAKHQKTAPVPVVSIAKGIGLQVFKATGWKDDLSGYIDHKRGRYSIYVNGSHHIHRRRFTIAHEIAHFVLHKDLIGDGVVDDALYRSGLGSGIEAQANNYAAEILMPKHLVVDAFRNKELRDVASLAELFNVSKSAMSIRLRVPFETTNSE